MRERSGSMNSSDPLVIFLYLLMRDHVCPCDVEKIADDSVFGNGEFTNGWLASHAQDLAQRLREVL